MQEFSDIRPEGLRLWLKIQDGTLRVEDLNEDEKKLFQETERGITQGEDADRAWKKRHDRTYTGRDHGGEYGLDRRPTSRPPGYGR